MENSHPIGLFDSGVGGLSILVEIKKLLPSESIVFLADQAHNPYGEKTPGQLRQLSEKTTDFLHKNHQIKILVVACNTATCYAIGHLRKKFKIPIIGVVPAVKPAISLSKNSRIVVMSTPATAKSFYLKTLIKNFASKSNVLKLGCDGLEEAIENLNISKINKLLDKYMNQVKSFGADVVVLGCTHFPFVKEEIKKRISDHIQIIDSGKAIAKRVKFILKEAKGDSPAIPKELFYTTGDPRKFSKVASTLLKYQVNGQKAGV